MKICVTRRETPDAKPKICVSPNASQWNIGCVGSLALGLCFGHVHFIFFVLISFASDTRRKPSFQWNMGFMVFMLTLIDPSRGGGLLARGLRDIFFPSPPWPCSNMAPSPSRCLCRPAWTRALIVLMSLSVSRSTKSSSLLSLSPSSGDPSKRLSRTSRSSPGPLSLDVGGGVMALSRARLAWGKDFFFYFLLIQTISHITKVLPTVYG